MRESPPLTTALAVAELKRYLPDPVQRIRLDDLMTSEARRAAVAVGEARFPTVPGAITKSDFDERLALYEVQMERLVSLLATGTRFGDSQEHDDLWVRSVLTVDNRPKTRAGSTALVDLQEYPTMLAVFALGLAGIATGDLSAFLRTVRATKRTTTGMEETVLITATPPGAFGHAATLFPQGPGLSVTPLSDHVHDVLLRQLGLVFASEEEFEDAFDLLEFLLAVLRAGLSGYPYLGRFWWKYFRMRPPVTNQGPSVEPFRTQLVAPGLFENHAALDAAVEQVRSIARTQP